MPGTGEFVGLGAAEPECAPSGDQVGDRRQPDDLDAGIPSGGLRRGPAACFGRVQLACRLAGMAMPWAAGDSGTSPARAASGPGGSPDGYAVGDDETGRTYGFGPADIVTEGFRSVRADDRVRFLTGGATLGQASYVIRLEPRRRGLPLTPIPISSDFASAPASVRPVLDAGQDLFRAQGFAAGPVAAGDPAWVIGLTGIALQGLRRAVASLAGAYCGGPADLQSEVLTGFLAALCSLDPDDLESVCRWPPGCAGLRRPPRCLSLWRDSPGLPWGLVLAAAVRIGGLTPARPG